MKLLKSLDPVLLLLILISIFFLFTNLGNIYLWTDEAETGFLARNILTFGYPRASDGINTARIHGQWSHFGKYDQHYLWTVQPWLQFYVAAASFALFGVNNFSARLPFALFGLGSIILTYYLSQKLFQNKIISRISTTLLVFSVPYLLHMRQCHYYALLPFFTLCLILYYLKFVEQKRFAILGITISATLLFHANYGAFISTLSAISLHYLIFHSKQRKISKLLLALIPTCLLTIPWFFYLRPLSHVTKLDLNNLRRQFEFYTRTINKYVFPLAFFAIVSLLAYFKVRIKPFAEAAGKKSQIWLIVLTIAAGIGLLIFVEQRIFRYMIHAVPFLYILQGIILANWFKKSKILTCLVLIVMLSSNFFNNPKIKFPIYDFLWELTHDYDGPNEGIVKFLNANAKPGERVKVPYADRPLIFYTKGLIVEYKGDFEKAETFPEWIIPRRHWVSDKFWKSPYHQKILSSYEKIELDYSDLQWGNRPEPGFHKYRTVTDAPKVIIFKRH
ncbi:MAG: glycosyltransferase family 39 protein [Candidatus Omnitrophica bacterium]|nr:glycosyltransferase family 39 protein [Candidatus Omnitrophota bacterium]